MNTAVERRSLVELFEEFSGGRDRRLIVAKFATRWFVLSGFITAPLSTYGVSDPLDHHEDALRKAIAMHEKATKRERAQLKVVEA